MEIETVKHKCDNCGHEFDMNVGISVCPKCGYRNWVPAKES